MAEDIGKQPVERETEGQPENVGTPHQEEQGDSLPVAADGAEPSTPDVADTYWQTVDDTETEPEEPKPTDIGHVGDMETDHARAIAEDPVRTEAAQRRALAKKLEAVEPAEEVDYDADYYGTAGRTGRFPGRSREERTEDKMVEEFGDDPLVRDDEFRRRHLPGDIIRKTAEEAVEESKGLKRKGERLYVINQRVEAKRLDMLADRIGDWAEVLEKNPPTAEFLKEYDLGELSPRDLVRIEDNIGRNLHRAEGWSSRLSHIESRHASELERLEDYEDGDVITDSLAFVLDVNMREACRSVDDDAAYLEFVKLASKDDTSIGDLKKAYDDLCQSQTRAINAEIGATRKFLADVRLGRTSEAA